MSRARRADVRRAYAICEIFNTEISVGFTLSKHKRCTELWAETHDAIRLAESTVLADQLAYRSEPARMCAAAERYRVALARVRTHLAQVKFDQVLYQRRVRMLTLALRACPDPPVDPHVRATSTDEEERQPDRAGSESDE